MTDSSLAPDVDTELLADLGVGIFTVDLTGRVQSSNRRAREVFALHDTVITADGLALAPYEVLDEHGQPLSFEELPLMRALRSGSSVAGVTLGFRAREGGVTNWHLCGAHVVRHDGDGEVVCTFVDVTEQRAAREALEERDRRFRHLAENSADMIFQSRIAPEWGFDYLNPAVEQVLGFPRGDFYADSDFAIRLMHPDDRRTVWDYFARIIDGAPDTDDSAVLRLSRADGGVLWAQIRAAAVRDGDEIVGIEGIVRDVTELKVREADLRYQAMHDTLTGIPNRASFLAALDGALERERSTGGALAVLYVDLDRFKTVNDGLGHDAGDRVLAALAARLAEVVRPSDNVGRIGGDEFAAVLSGLRDADEAAHIAARLLDALGEPLVLAEGALVTTASIGVAFTADCAQTSAELLRRADVAMYEAKDRGRSRVEHYEAPSSLGRGARRHPDSLEMLMAASGGFVPPPYPHDRLAALAERAAAAPGGIVDVSVGTPVDPMPDVAVDALVAAARGATGYPTTIGSRDLRTAAAGWIERRFGVTLTAADIVACIGTKELVASLPRALSLRDPSRDVVLYPGVSYPTYAMGATLAGLRPVPVPVDERWRPRLDQVDPADAERALVLWLNDPSNPTGVVSTPAEMAASIAWARARGAIVASDECYAEFTYDADGAPADPITALTSGADGVLAVHSLSKRSNMAGLRAGFVAGDRELVTYLGEMRKHGGLMTPDPVQAAAAAALADDAHVEEQQARYARRRAVALPVLESWGLVHDGGTSAFYLWLRDPSSARRGWDLAADLAETGLLVAPGDIYGPAGDLHVRVALTLTDDQLTLACERLEDALRPAAGSSAR